MNRTDEILLRLVRYAVQTDCNEHIAFDGADWNEMFSQAQAQAIPVLVADGLQAFLSSHPNEKPFAYESAAEKAKRFQWLGQVLLFERLYAKHERGMADLAKLYAAHDIRMMVLKGYGLSLDWPKPQHRAVGDLDTYNFGKWEEADALVTRECGIKVDDGHEHHTVFLFEGVAVENHYDFINVHAHRDAPAIEKHLKALAEKDCQEIVVQGAKIALPSANFNAIFLMRHMGQHFAGSHLSLRQLLDWGFFVQAHHEDVDWDATIEFLKGIGLLTFFNQINAICVDFLGFSEMDFPPVERDKETELRILGDILHPEFSEVKPSSGLARILAFKWRRWWHNRWKHPLVYKEWLLPMFLTLLWSHLRRVRTIAD